MAAKMKPREWIVEEYNQFKKLPPTDVNLEPYKKLAYAIMKNYVIALYGAYIRGDTDRVAQIKSVIKRNGIAEMIGISPDYLYRLAISIPIDEISSENERGDN